MENKVNYYGQSMDDIVFDNRNKGYGAYFLRNIYEKHLLKALGISVVAFVFSMYTPSIAKSLGWFEEKEVEEIDTTTIALAPPPSIKKDEPEPPPPPPEPEVQRPTERFLEMEAVKKEEVDEPPPPPIDDLKDKDIGDKKIEGDPTNEPPPIIEQVGTGPVVDPNKVWTKVEQMPEFPGGERAMMEYLEDNQEYPDDERNNEITGLCVVRFVVNESGKVDQVRIEKSSGNRNLDAEAIRLVRGFPHFKPGKQNGVAVKVESKIEIAFEIQD